MKKKIICLIPARSGSKRIKNKNIIKINSKSLIDLVCEKVNKSKLIKYFYIASDKKKIFNNIQNKKKFLFYKRSKKSSNGTSKTEAVILEFLKKNNNICDILVLIQITNPFINYKIIDEAISKFIKKKYDSMLSVVESNKFIWKNKKINRPINYNIFNRPMSQNIQNYLIENGSFYIFNVKSFIKYKNRLHGKIGFYKMSKESQFEIDDLEDLKIVKKLLF